MKNIYVMGPGCPKCTKALQMVKEVIAENNVSAEVTKISDFQEIAKYGVFSTPAIVIDNEVMMVGKVPKKKELLEWIK